MRLVRTLLPVVILVSLLGPWPAITPARAQAALPTQLQIVSTANAAQTSVPVTWGQVFVPGAVPGGSTLTASLNGVALPLQVDIKARHADGSVRHAVLSVIVPALAANARLPLSLGLGAAASGPAPTAAGLLATPFDARVSLTLGGTVYSASARDGLANPGSPWLSGPVVSEWTLMVPLRTSGGQAHPHLTAYFHVRAYQGLQRARVDVIVENTWAYEPNPSNLTYDAAVTIAGASVFQQSALEHYRQARWRKTFWWGGAPAVAVRHDAAYVMATRAVANYDRTVTVSEATLAALAAEWTGPKTQLMNVGELNPYMPSTGGRIEIGALPGWAVIYLLTQDPRAAAVTYGTADLAGTWGIHYRDRNTGRPVSLDDYPYMSLLGNPGDMVNPQTGRSEAFPACSGWCDSPFTPDSAHQPSLAYLPYLLSGDVYYLDELHFWANYNMLQHNPYYREFRLGLIKPDQIRGQAWSLRELGYAAYITPDAHPLKGYFVEKLNNNIDWFTNAYVGGPGANGYGVVTHAYAFAYSNGRGVAPWQDDFFTWSVGQLVDLGFERARPFYEFKVRFAIQRLTAPGYCWIYAANYSLNLRAVDTGPLYPTWAEIYAANVPAQERTLACGGSAMGQALGLQPGEMVGYSSSAMGYPSNLQPAVAMAAQSGVPDGRAAWDRFMARAVKPDYGPAPQFAIVPREPYVPQPPPPPPAHLRERVWLVTLRR